MSLSVGLIRARWPSPPMMSWNAGLVQLARVPLSCRPPMKRVGSCSETSRLTYCDHGSSAEWVQVDAAVGRGVEAAVVADVDVAAVVGVPDRDVLVGVQASATALKLSAPFVDWYMLSPATYSWLASPGPRRPGANHQP